MSKTKSTGMIPPISSQLGKAWLCQTEILRTLKKIKCKPAVALIQLSTRPPTCHANEPYTLNNDHAKWAQTSHKSIKLCCWGFIHDACDTIPKYYLRLD